MRQRVSVPIPLLTIVADMAQADGSGVVLPAHLWDAALSDASAEFQAHLSRECAQSAAAQAARQADAVRVKDVIFTDESKVVVSAAVSMVMRRAFGPNGDHVILANGDHFILAFLEERIATLPSVAAFFAAREIEWLRLRDVLAQCFPAQ